jgi:hypothetical protein
MISFAMRMLIVLAVVISVTAVTAILLIQKHQMAWRTMIFIIIVGALALAFSHNPSLVRLHVSLCWRESSSAVAVGADLCVCAHQRMTHNKKMPNKGSNHDARTIGTPYDDELGEVSRSDLSFLLS